MQIIIKWIKYLKIIILNTINDYYIGVLKT